jgi:outer membrane immunogenic protein
MNRSIKVVLSAAVAAMSFAVPALAADLPARMAVKAPPAPLPVATWTGFYAGANIGYGSGVSSTSTSSVLSSPGGPFINGGSDIAVTGAVGGFQLGYNWQIDPSWLIGVEGDFQWAGQRGSFNTTDLVADSINVESKLDWFATVRGRFGVITGNTLWYVTGGWAEGRRELNVTSALVAPILSGALSTTADKSGWVAGGGVETKLWNSNWSAKLEYLHLDLGEISSAYPLTANGAAVPNSSTATSSHFHDEIVRVGVNYKFF